MCISIHIMFSSPENFQGVHRIPCCLASRFKNGRPREGLFINEKGFCVARAEVCQCGKLQKDRRRLEVIEGIYGWIDRWADR